LHILLFIFKEALFLIKILLHTTSGERKSSHLLYGVVVYLNSYVFLKKVVYVRNGVYYCYITGYPWHFFKDMILAKTNHHPVRYQSQNHLLSSTLYDHE
jgi:hypothetical protein